MKIRQGTLLAAVALLAGAGAIGGVVKQSLRQEILKADGVSPPPVIPKKPPTFVSPSAVVADGVSPPPVLPGKPPKFASPSMIVADGVSPPPVLPGKPPKAVA